MTKLKYDRSDCWVSSRSLVSVLTMCHSQALADVRVLASHISHVNIYVMIFLINKLY